MSIEEHYVSGIVIQRYTSVSDGAGGQTKTWSTHLTVDGRIRPLSGYERSQLDKQTVRTTHRLYTAVADIKARDRVVYDSDTYLIQFVANPGTRSHHLEIDLELVE